MIIKECTFDWNMEPFEFTSIRISFHEISELPEYMQLISFLEIFAAYVKC